MIRLLELGDQVQAEVPDIGRQRAPGFLQDVTMSAVPRPGALKNVAMFRGRSHRLRGTLFDEPDDSWTMEKP